MTNLELEQRIINLETQLATLAKRASIRDNDSESKVLEVNSKTTINANDILELGASIVETVVDEYNAITGEE